MSARGAIVAIGGGELAEGETLAIDREIVALSGKAAPRLLFLPTASGDAEGYVETVRAVFGGSLGCRVEALRLNEPGLADAAIEDALGSADIVYVGGGNTRAMMAAWKARGLDTRLRAAWERGAVLSGLSAGSICWFERGASDSDSFEGKSDWTYSEVEGLGFLPGLHGPHHDERRGEEAYRGYLRSLGENLLGIENRCALCIVDGRYRILRADSEKHVWLVPAGAGLEGERKLADEGSMAEVLHA